MGGLESVLTALTDIMPRKWSNYKHFRPLLTFVVLGSACSVAFVNTASGGMYVFNLMDRYLAGTSLLIGSLFQVIGIAWFYGLNTLCMDIKSMSLPTPNVYWRFCWKFLTPITLIIMIVSSLTDPTPLQYNYGAKHPELLGNNSEVINITLHGTSQHYKYPKWANYLGWVMSGVSVSMIPLVICIYLVRTRCKYSVSNFFSFGPMDFWPVVRDRTAKPSDCSGEIIKSNHNIHYHNYDENEGNDNNNQDVKVIHDKQKLYNEPTRIPIQIVDSK